MPVRRRSRRVAVAVSLALMVALVGTIAIAPSAGARRAIISKNYYLSSSTFSRAGSPYAWRFSVSKSSFGASLSVSASRKMDNGNLVQSHSWSFSLPSSAVTVKSDLSSATVGTTDKMAPFGKVDMKFSPSKKAVKSVSKCPKNGDVLSTTYNRQGAFSGTFRFVPNDPGLPDVVKRTKIGGTAQKTLTTDATCSYPETCTSSSTSLLVYNSKGSLSVFRSGKRTTLSFSASESMAPASIYHSIQASGLPKSAFSWDQTGDAVVNTSGAAPFMGKTTLKTNGSNKQHPASKCTEYTTWTEKWKTGKVVGKFDTGDVTLTGSTISGGLYQRVA